LKPHIIRVSLLEFFSSAGLVKSDGCCLVMLC